MKRPSHTPATTATTASRGQRDFGETLIMRGACLHRWTIFTLFISFQRPWNPLPGPIEWKEGAESECFLLLCSQLEARFICIEVSVPLRKACCCATRLCLERLKLSARLRKNNFCDFSPHAAVAISRRGQGGVTAPKQTAQGHGFGVCSCADTHRILC